MPLDKLFIKSQVVDKFGCIIYHHSHGKEYVCNITLHTYSAKRVQYVPFIYKKVHFVIKEIRY